MLPTPLGPCSYYLLRMERPSAPVYAVTPIQLSVTSLRVSDSMKLFLTLSLPSQEKGPQLYTPHGDV